MTAITDARTALGEVVLAARSLALVLAEAEAVQWTAAPRPRPEASPDEPRIKGKGGPPSNPTADAALDDARLVLRERVRASEHALRDLLVTIRTAEEGVADALTAWSAGPPPGDLA